MKVDENAEKQAQRPRADGFLSVNVKFRYELNQKAEMMRCQIGAREHQFKWGESKMMKTKNRLFVVLIVAMGMLAAGTARSEIVAVWGKDLKTGCQVGFAGADATVTDVSWIGPVVNGKAEGHGRFRATINAGKLKLTYEGEGDFKSGIPDGLVKMKSTEGFTYEGYYKEGDRHGKGIMRFTDGETFDGDWFKGSFTGSGVHTYPNGDRYEGQFIKHEANGKGRKSFRTRNGICIYDGDWKGGQFNGQGLYKWPLGQTYEGGFKNGKQNGYGVMKDINGKVVYAGEYIDGQEVKKAE
ncbi:MAG TPA: hypothetical protein VN371_00975 [Chlorobaculum sp.]|nr:hypothetical protein [Chlorobaculum sp.]